MYNVEDFDQYCHQIATVMYPVVSGPVHLLLKIYFVFVTVMKRILFQYVLHLVNEYDGSSKRFLFLYYHLLI